MVVLVNWASQSRDSLSVGASAEHSELRQEAAPCLTTASEPLRGAEELPRGREVRHGLRGPTDP